MPLKPAVFIDKDGTLVEDVPYNVDPSQIRFVAGAIGSLQRLQAAGFALIVVSNQAGLALGRFNQMALDRCLAWLRALLRHAGVELTGMFYCPHDPRGSVAAYRRACACRKPMPGLLHAAAQFHDVDLARSWMIGDILDDVEAGRRAGCRTVLLDVGHETQWQWSPWRRPDASAPNWEAAERAVLS